MNNFTKIDYNQLNSKQKENYNYHKVASALADYGYDSMRLNNDWQGADFIAVNGDNMIKVQLKGRFTLDKKYIGKDIYVAFIENNIVKIYIESLVILRWRSSLCTSLKSNFLLRDTSPSTFERLAVPF